MASKGKSIESLLEAGSWDDARRQIDRELERDSDNHWLLTQLGVTHYEQKRYAEALQPLLRSLEIVPDCPLTLWNLAGTLDALGKPREALAIYVWLIRTDKTPDDDSCWESRQWTDALKTDCVYRCAVCFQHLEMWEEAEHVFHRYIDLLFAGMEGSYSIEDAAGELRKHPIKKTRKTSKDARGLFESALQDLSGRDWKFKNGMPPKFTRASLGAGT